MADAFERNTFRNGSTRSAMAHGNAEAGDSRISAPSTKTCGPLSPTLGMLTDMLVKAHANRKKTVKRYHHYKLSGWLSGSALKIFDSEDWRLMPGKTPRNQRRGTQSSTRDSLVLDSLVLDCVLRRWFLGVFGRESASASSTAANTTVEDTPEVVKNPSPSLVHDTQRQIHSHPALKSLLAQAARRPIISIIQKRKSGQDILVLRKPSGPGVRRRCKPLKQALSPKFNKLRVAPSALVLRDLEEVLARSRRSSILIVSRKGIASGSVS